MRLAVCIVAQDKNGRLLIVARKNHPDDWNLPGGKVELFESLERAASRELREETGLTAPSFIRVFVDVIDDFVAVCYIASSIKGNISQQPGEGEVRWGSWDDILTEKSVFHHYNQKLYNELVNKGLI